MKAHSAKRESKFSKLFSLMLGLAATLALAIFSAPEPLLPADGFLPAAADLPKIRLVHNGGIKDGGDGGEPIYRGARATLYSDYYLPRALEANEKATFQWYENTVDSLAGATAIAHAAGNVFIVDTSRTGIHYYHYVLQYEKGDALQETVTSAAIPVSVQERTGGDLLSTLLTPAEASGWRTTTSSADLVSYYEKVAANSQKRIKTFSMGKTPKGREMPLVVLGYPEAPARPDEVSPDKAVVLVNCNIHSGEVEGKEAMMIFAREVAQGRHDDLLQDIIILLIPNFNADGNDDLGKRRNNTQYTPEVVGTRFTGASVNPYVKELGIAYSDNSEQYNFYNINRDMTKLDTVEARAAVKVMNEWDPVIFIDAHATNGSYMRHAITYNWGLHPDTDPDILAYNRDEFSQNAVGENSYLYKKQGKVAVPYGNFARNNVTSPWRTFEDYPRYTTNYAGLRNRLALLLEVYSHDPYSVRVDTQYACIYGTLLAVRQDKRQIKALIAQADARSLARAKDGAAPADKVALNSEMKFLADITLLGYASTPDGTVISANLTDDEGDRSGTLFAGAKDYTVPYYGLFVPTGEEDMGAYYLIDADSDEAIQLLDHHGIEYRRLTAPLTIAAGGFQWFHATKRDQYPAPTSERTLGNVYEGHLRNRFAGSWEKAATPQTFPAGTYIVSTAQSRGSLAALLLEPASVDGAVTWNFFDARLATDDPKTVRSKYPNTIPGTDGLPSLTLGIPIFKVAAYSVARKPDIVTQPLDVVVAPSEKPVLAVVAVVATAPDVSDASDGGRLSYQWYENSVAATTGGKAIAGATEASYAPPSDHAGYYYVVVTNTDNGKLSPTSQTTSDVAAVKLR